MAQIFDRNQNWELSIFPNLTPIEILDEPTKGYRAELAFDETTGRHVVSNVIYSKEVYSIDDVIEKVKTLKDCDACDTLDKERLRLESINIPTPPMSSPPPVTYPPSTVPVPSNNPPLSKMASPNVKELFSNIVMDAYLTDPGKYFLGLMLDDQTLLESAYPPNKDGIPAFMEDMIDFMSGKTEFMRSPAEAREFLSVMREGTDEDDRSTSPAAKRSLPSSMGNIVIY